MTALYWVTVCAVRKRRGRRRKTTVVKRWGPMSYAEATATQEAKRTQWHDHVVRINEDRTEYFAAYHRKRYQTDEKYRETRKKRALDRQRRERATARGDMTPWLE